MEQEQLFEMTAQTFQGLEEILAQELEGIGAENIEVKKRAVTFEGNKETMYKANLWLRTAIRVLVPLERFVAKDEDELYENAKKIDWTKYLDLYSTFAIDSSVSSPIFTHSQYVALKVKDAIADHFRERTGGKRPSVDVERPNVSIHIRISDDKCILSLDSSGTPLFRRGYKTEQKAAPLNESLAAAMIYMSGWKGERNFVDPMCGSGTILVEAALIATNTAPGLFRSEYGFLGWKDADRRLWRKLIREAKRAQKDINCKILGSDIDPDAIDVTAGNIERAGMDDYISIRQIAFQDRQVPKGEGVLICNPPYGERIGGDIEDIELLYKELGDKMKQDFTGYDAWILSASTEGLKSVGLKTSKKVDLLNGGLECKYVKYELYEGSRKEKAESEE
ncbi:THUMP domain-containing class I SAM-dependent RNA methyltransferase [Sediminitomix flava]|uniref:Putative N6-adenine-specific DNA methylase n=1 Tax=Sediminitomix flava TaxID=379075 RepID=A0A315ZGJ7_SEDFL|nr:THUMP domain-containing protein [Sediminitomix flava]PWJ44279.1 putative N6-adenine-specific DNA methylase [Sediminitomix flava]